MFPHNQPGDHGKDQNQGLPGIAHGHEAGSGARSGGKDVRRQKGKQSARPGIQRNRLTMRKEKRMAGGPPIAAAPLRTPEASPAAIVSGRFSRRLTTKTLTQHQGQHENDHRHRHFHGFRWKCFQASRPQKACRPPYPSTAIKGPASSRGARRLAAGRDWRPPPEAKPPAPPEPVRKKGDRAATVIMENPNPPYPRTYPATTTVTEEKKHQG